jgi:regulator of nonsense transcripts 2
LVKFRVAHHSVAFDIWNFCLNDFSPTAIYVCCSLLESCGRWLYKNGETNERCRGNLEKMNNLKTAKFLDDQSKVMIENAFFTCVPQERVVIPREVKPLLHEYIRKLVYSDLQVKGVEFVTEKILRLSWDDECWGYVRLTFIEVYNVEYSNIPLVAQLISKINRTHTIGTTLVDDVIEEIRFGMELNNFMDSQQRISYVRFLGELFNAGVADFMTIVSVLYQIVMFGFEWTKAGTLESRIDSPRDSFRIRLVAALLESCGRYFSSGIKKRKLDTFLIYLQRYIFLKEVIPVDVEFVVDDLFDTLRPRMERFRNIAQCQQKINEIEQEAMRNGGLQEEFEDEEDGDDNENEAENEAEPENVVDEDELKQPDDVSNDEDEEEEEEEQEQLSRERNYDWTSRGLSQRAKGNTEEDEDFLQLLDKTIVEDVESRKYESRAVRNLVDADTLAIQALSKSSRGATTPVTPSSGPTSSMFGSGHGGGMVAVQLLTKKNKNVYSRQLGVPMEEKLVEKMQHKDQTHEEEQKLMKRLVVAGIERAAKEE